MEIHHFQWVDQLEVSIHGHFQQLCLFTGGYGFDVLDCAPWAKAVSVSGSVFRILVATVSPEFHSRSQCQPLLAVLLVNADEMSGKGNLACWAGVDVADTVSQAEYLFKNQAES